MELLGSVQFLLVASGNAFPCFCLANRLSSCSNIERLCVVKARDEYTLCSLFNALIDLRGHVIFVVLRNAASSVI